MTNDTIREHCLSMPHTTETVQWGDHLLFKVGGKMFAIIALDGHSRSLKCTAETYAELVEMEDIVPASHNMWKYQWVTTETLGALPDRQFREPPHHVVRAGAGRPAEAVRAALDAGEPVTTVTNARKARVRGAKGATLRRR